MPNPPRTTIWPGAVAENPTRGPMFEKSFLTPTLGSSSVATTILPSSGMNRDIWLSASVTGVYISYRRPRFRVSHDVARQSSWKYTAGSQLRFLGWMG